MKFLMPLLLGLSTATTVVAHPHVFIDTGLELIVDESGQLTHVRVIWEYDDLYSLLITEDMALDPDGDGVLTPDEIAKLTGFDMQWIDGFNGDLVIENKDGLVALSGPQEPTASFGNGRITTTHLRALEQPLAPGETAAIKPYDATYYTAYEITRPVDVIGDVACKTEVQVPDVSAGLMALQQELAMLDPQMDPSDAGLPEIGAQMASTVIVTCGGS
jgi:ABC-type uncharacterized transport system substrate-binding protein